MAGNGVVADLQDDSKGRLRSTVILVALADSDPPNKPKRNKLAFACAFLVSLTTIILGYDMGVMSGAIMFIKKDFDITDVEIQVLVGIINFYSIIGSLLAGKTSDWIGRRYTIMLADAIFFAAALLMAFATNYAFLMVGRFVAGIGVGYALTIAPVYIAEVSPPASRGYLTSFPEELRVKACGTVNRTIYDASGTATGICSSEREKALSGVSHPENDIKYVDSDCSVRSSIA